MSKTPDDAVALFGRATLTSLGSIKNTTPETEWTDEIFQTKYAILFSTESYKAQDIQAAAATAMKYFAVYLGQETYEVKDHLNLLYVVLANATMADKETHLFLQGAKTTGGYTTTIKEITRFQFAGGSSNTHTGEFTVSQKDINGFYKEMLAKSTELTTDGPYIVVNCAAFCAMNSFRLIKKDPIAVQNHMLGAARTSFMSLYSYTIDHHIACPSEEYIKLFKGHFDAGMDRTKGFLAYFVATWADQVATMKKAGYLKAGCLLSLCENGLGAVSWAAKAAEKLHVELGAYLMTCCFDNSTETQALRVAKFAADENKGITWPWCRLFDENAKSNLNNKNNPEISIISAIIVMNSAVAVAELEQFGFAQYLINHLEPYAYAVVETLRPEVPVDGRNSQSTKAVSHLRSILASGKKFTDRTRPRTTETRRRRRQAESESDSGDEETFKDVD